MDTGKTLSELRKVCTKFPQIVVNVRVKDKPAWDTLPDVMQLVKEVEGKLNGQGRVCSAIPAPNQSPPPHRGPGW